MELFIYQQIKKAIEQTQRALIVSHRKPDGDTLGASLALSLVFKDLNKDYFLFCQDKIEKQFSFIGETYKYSQSKEGVIQFNPDFIFCFDCADLKQTGFEDIKEKFPKAKVINIDHHISNPSYGDVNLVDANASSTCEILYYLLKEIDISITKQIATMIFLGIFTDTNNFSNSATTPRSLFAASELWHYGILISEIQKNLFKNKTISFLRLWGLALERIKYNENLKIASTYITGDDLASLGIDGDSLDGLSNFLNANLNVETIAVLKDLGDGIIKGSLRTISDEIDLSKLARVFGGGGHKKASGFSVKGKIKTIGNSWFMCLD